MTNNQSTHKHNFMIVLLICDQFPGILTPDIPSYEWMFERVLRSAGYGGDFLVLQTWRDQLPESLNCSDLYIISGSNESAYSSTPWVAQLRRWMIGAYVAGCHLAGICFGHQIIAESLGGHVVRSPKGWGIGLRQSEVVDPLLAEMVGGTSLTLVYDHHDQVVGLPVGASITMSSEFCPVDGFRIGRQVLTLQGHPEFTNEFISHWINDCAPDEAIEVKHEALRSLGQLRNQGVEAARMLLSFFGLG